MLEREELDFRFVQDPVFNLSASEEAILGRLRRGKLEFGLLPRYDPTSFLRVQVRLEGVSQLVEIALEGDELGYASFITRRTPFADRLLEKLKAVFGAKQLDRSRLVSTRDFVWFSFFLERSQEPALPIGGAARPLFNFDAKEMFFLKALADAVRRFNGRDGKGLQFRIYPREASFGGIELMLAGRRQSQPAKIFAKGLYPVTYHFITENTPLGSQVPGYLHAALGASHFDEVASRLGGRFLSLVYTLSLPEEFSVR
ncbi:MAG: hypothetical protein HY319_27800 [Armatimonadetes bacterium]|nr:hypothetical protein [Armatimonadota bacterium]